LLTEFEQQIKTLVSLRYPEMLGLSDHAFRDHIAALAAFIPDEHSAKVDVEQGRVPFVIVTQSERAPTGLTLPLVEREGKQAIEKLYPIAPELFVPIKSITIPNGLAYLLRDIDRGQETLNVTPNDALTVIQDAGRSPLTINEGIALLTQYPQLLRKNQCFSLLGSRCGDQRVPALWLSERRVKLGWCWAGNPHTWLGSASCADRIGADSENSFNTSVDLAQAHSS
jgi:hypothetical protein